MKISIIFLGIAFLVHPLFLFSQPSEEQAKSAVQKNDSLFWVAFNNCDTSGMGQYLDKDVEFYHDKGGIQMGSAEVLSVTKKNLCSNPDFHLRREAVKGSVRLFVLKNNETIYGVIEEGKHTFLITNAGKPEFADGIANFSNLWLIKNGRWTMHRIYSYDHAPAK